MARKRKMIGLNNRLQIVIQAILDYQEEGGETDFLQDEEGSVCLLLPGVAYDEAKQALYVMGAEGGQDG